MNTKTSLSSTDDFFFSTQYLIIFYISSPGTEGAFTSFTVCVILCRHVHVLLRFMIFIMKPCI